jgi:hypothetical protein
MTTWSPSGSGNDGHSSIETTANAAAPIATASASDTLPTSESTG